jgi:hypothetical protein
MIRNLLVLAALGGLLAVVASCQSTAGGAQKCEGCDKAKAANGWCDHCKMGFKPDGTTTKCKMCHSGATGQAVWCDGCKKGYAGGKATTCKGCFEQAKGGPKCAT